MFPSYILPEEILLIIFNLCDIYTLSQISCVSKQFCRISNAILKKKINNLLVPNQMSEKFRKRCNPLLPLYNSKFITHYNWKSETYKRSYISKIPTFDLSAKCLHMTKNIVWLYNNNDLSLLAYNRAKDGTIKKDATAVFYDSKVNDIAYCNDVIITGHQDSSIRLWRIKSQDKKDYPQLLKIHPNVHQYCVNKVDATSQYIISTEENSIKIQKNIYEENSSVEEIKIFKNGFVNSISFDPTETKFAASACHNFLPFVIYDINKSCLIMKERNDNCFQLLWEDCNTILMCCRRYIKKMDMRTSKFVSIWDNPLIENFLCFSSDNMYTVVTGMSGNHVILWDQRQSASIQTYNVNCSPHQYTNMVFSVQFDSAHMYAFTIPGLIEFDFMGRDYKRILESSVLPAKYFYLSPSKIFVLAE